MSWLITQQNSTEFEYVQIRWLRNNLKTYWINTLTFAIKKKTQMETKNILTEWSPANQKEQGKSLEFVLLSIPVDQKICQTHCNTYFFTIPTNHKTQENYIDIRILKSHDVEYMKNMWNSCTFASHESVDQKMTHGEHSDLWWPRGTEHCLHKDDKRKKATFITFQTTSVGRLWVNVDGVGSSTPYVSDDTVWRQLQEVALNYCIPDCVLDKPWPKLDQHVKEFARPLTPWNSAIVRRRHRTQELLNWRSEDATRNSHRKPGEDSWTALRQSGKSKACLSGSSSGGNFVRSEPEPR